MTVEHDDDSRWLALCVAMVGALVLTLMLVTSGCSPLAAAVTTSNATLAALDTARPHVDDCGAAWAEAVTPADVADVDRVCLPLVQAYRATRLAHAALVAALVLAQARGSGDVTQAVQRALDASTALARALAEVTPR